MKAHLLILGMIAVFCAPSTAAAQRRMPHENANSVGGEVGVFAPRQDGWTTGPALEGFLEHYLTSRDSLRLAAGWMNPKEEVDHNARTRQVRIGADLIHNWEGGALHPFVGAGLGAYFLQRRVNGVDAGDGATKLGGDLLGGVEYFTSNTFSIKGEARYNVVQKWNGYNPSGLVLSIGAKAYF